MRRRLLWLLLICIAIPLQGWAATPWHVQPCPMTASAASAETGAVEHAETHDCCNDAESLARTGQPCKAGQDCPAPPLYTTPDSAAARHAPLPGAAPVWAELLAPGRVSVAIWRPPAPR